MIQKQFTIEQLEALKLILPQFKESFDKEIKERTTPISDTILKIHILNFGKSMSELGF